MDALNKKTSSSGWQANENEVKQSDINTIMPAIKSKSYLYVDGPIDHFKQAIEKAGMTPPDHITSGQMERFSGTGQKDRNAWAIFFLNIDGTAGGCFGDWKTGFSETWLSNGNRTLSAGQQREFDRMLREAKERYESELKEKHRAAAIEAQKIWDRATPAPPDHPYLIQKGVKPYGIRCQGKALIIPVMDAGGAISSLQRILPDGQKRFLPDGKTKGGRFIIGDPAGSDKIFIGEGYATGASIHEATGKPVVVAFNAGNLEAVARHISKLYPDHEIIITGDNDLKTEGNPGKAKAEEAAAAIGAAVVLPSNDGDFNDLYGAEGLEAVRTQLLEAQFKPDAMSTEWDLAKQLFPKTAFPWEAFPLDIADSIKQLARSCATSSQSLPGAAMAVFASVLGATVSISPKRSWKAPLIFWFVDIRESGDGKTHAARALLNPLYAAQTASDKDYEMRIQEWQAKDKKDRGPEPKRARGYYMSDLTLEGIREDLSGHGGTVCVLDELSALLNAQNQYKSKGTDREAWLSLYDGKPTRIVRASKSKTITGARLNLFGGIQPAVWRKVFGGDDGIYLVDGTVYRLLPTYEGSKFYPLTEESWSKKNQAVWENTLSRAMTWADNKISDEKWKPTVLMLDSEAGQHFIAWRNDLYSQRKELPKPIRDFIPKITGAALRLAGVLYCIRRFNLNSEPGQILTIEDMQRGIDAARFYMGHIVGALHLMTDKNHITDEEITDQVKHLVKTLEILKPEIDSGRLAIGYIWERFNENCKPELKLSNAKAMGALLRSCELTITAGVHNANGKRSVKCLIWDEKINKLLKTCLQCLQRLSGQENKGRRGADVELSMSAMSANNDQNSARVQTLQTTDKQRLYAGTTDNKEFTDNADIADVFSSVNKKTGRVTGTI